MAFTEAELTEVQYVRTQAAWRIFWKQADGKWHAYKPHPEARTLHAALLVITEDAHACFFG